MNDFYLERHDGMYLVRHRNGVSVGELIAGLDGYYSFWNIADGCFDGQDLIDIGNLVIGLNRDWDNKVREEIGNE